MNKGRTSYIPQSKTKNSLAWPIMTLISFLIILVLLVLLVISHLDSINNIINIADYENKIEELKEEYDESLIQTNEVNDRLLLLKNELVDLEETEGTKLNFLYHMQTLSDIKTKFPQQIYQSFNTRNILKECENKIFISDDGNVCVLMSYMFSGSSSAITKTKSDFFKVLAKKIYEILTDDIYGKFVSSVNIDVYTQTNDQDEVNLALKRGYAFKKKLLESNNDLNNLSGDKLLVRSFEDSKSLNDANYQEKDERIEITLTINNDSILGGIKKFVEVLPSTEETKK